MKTLNNEVNPLLLHLLQQKRPSGSEHVTVEWIIRRISPTVDHVGEIIYNTRGELMALRIDVGEPTTTLLTCHLDTVERGEGINELSISTSMSGDSFITAKDSILGADDGAGIYVLLRLINLRKAATYMFFAGEESGGIGSRYYATTREIELKQFNRAIAVDRRGESDVIVVQQGYECCSREFASSLCDILGVGYMPTIGIYTDTAEFTSVISECSNISAGYYNEHTSKESLNVSYLERLIQALFTADFEKLPVKRERVVPTYGYYDDVYRIDSRKTPYLQVGEDDIMETMDANAITITDLIAYIKYEGFHDRL